MSIEHEEQNNRFFARIDGELATLNYQMIGDVMNIIHTEVPESGHGQGIGGKLVRAAVEWARDSGKRIDASCRFASKWLERHDEYDNLVTTS